MLDIFHIDGQDTVVLSSESRCYKVLKEIYGRFLIKKLGSETPSRIYIQFEDVVEISTGFSEIALSKFVKDLVTLGLLRQDFLRLSMKTYFTPVFYPTDKGISAINELNSGTEIRLPYPS